MPTMPVPWRLLLALAVLPFADALLRMGRLHPDEVYQSLDPANFLAFGYGIRSWEWDVGLRNWAVPGLFAGLLKLAAALGITDVQARRAVVALPQLGLHLAMLRAVWAMAARRVDARSAAWAMAIVGTYPLVVFFGGRTMSESFSGALLVWAFERLDAALAGDVRPSTSAMGGALLGLAQVTRYGSAAFIIPALVFLLAARRFQVLAWCIAGGAAVALGLGVLDRFTWGATLSTPRFGGWWHSLFEYIDYNLISGKAAQFGVEPGWFYAARLFAPAAPAVLLWRHRTELRNWLPLVAAAAYFVAVSSTPHKEDRFLYPMLLVLTSTAAPAAGWWVDQVLQRQGALVNRVVLLAAVAASVAVAVRPSGFTPARPEQFRLTVRASREGTGLIVMNEGLWGAGGTFYAGGSNVFFGGRDKPAQSLHAWCTCDFPGEGCFQIAAQTPAINRAIFMDPHDERRTASTLAEFQRIGFREVDRDGDGHYLMR